jgi:membrane-associated protein
MTRQYYHRYGKSTIILARFIPGIRSFAPFVAGIIRMDYPIFLVYNVTGAILWVTGFVTFGYLIASLPIFKGSQDLFLWAILIISIGIFFLMMYNFRKNMKECVVPTEESLDDLAKDLNPE